MQARKTEMTKTVRARYTLEFKQPQGQLLGQRLQRDPVRFVEGGATAWAALLDAAPGQGRGHRLGTLVQPHPAALHAGVRQPGAVRARLACGSGQASQFLTPLWGTDSRGKVTTADNLLKSQTSIAS